MARVPDRIGRKGTPKRNSYKNPLEQPIKGKYHQPQKQKRKNKVRSTPLVQPWHK